MVDFSLPIEQLRELNSLCRFTWIDHHTSAINSCTDQDKRDIRGLRDDKKAGCELTWEFFVTKNLLPEWVRLLGRYDVWDNKDAAQWEHQILPFQYGMRLADPAPEDVEFWSALMNEVFRAEVIRAGANALAYQRVLDKETCERTAFEATLNGLRLIVSNNPRRSSMVFDSVWNPDKYDAMMSFYRRPDGKWTHSVYTTKDDVDLSVLAKSMGGGGHKKAAGWVSERPDIIAFP